MSEWEPNKRAGGLRAALDNILHNTGCRWTRSRVRAALEADDVLRPVKCKVPACVKVELRIGNLGRGRCETHLGQPRAQ